MEQGQGFSFVEYLRWFWKMIVFACLFYQVVSFAFEDISEFKLRMAEGKKYKDVIISINFLNMFWINIWINL